VRNEEIATRFSEIATCSTSSARTRSAACRTSARRGQLESLTENVEDLVTARPRRPNPGIGRAPPRRLRSMSRRVGSHITTNTREIPSRGPGPPEGPRLGPEEGGRSCGRSFGITNLDTLKAAGGETSPSPRQGIRREGRKRTSCMRSSSSRRGSRRSRRAARIVDTITERMKASKTVERSRRPVVPEDAGNCGRRRHPCGWRRTARRPGGLRASPGRRRVPRLRQTKVVVAWSITDYEGSGDDSGGSGDLDPATVGAGCSISQVRKTTNIRLRTMAERRGLKMNDTGRFPRRKRSRHGRSFGAEPWSPPEIDPPGSDLGSIMSRAREAPRVEILFSSRKNAVLIHLQAARSAIVRRRMLWSSNL